jgi:hypothetical protein
MGRLRLVPKHSPSRIYALRPVPILTSEDSTAPALRISAAVRRHDCSLL